MDKLGLKIMLLGFWLILPIPLMLFGIGGFTEVQMANLTKSPTNALEFGSFFFNLITIYLNLLVFNIPNVSFLLARFVNVLQIMTLIVIFEDFLGIAGSILGKFIGGL